LECLALAIKYQRRCPIIFCTLASLLGAMAAVGYIRSCGKPGMCRCQLLSSYGVRVQCMFYVWLFGSPMNTEGTAHGQHCCAALLTKVCQAIDVKLSAMAADVEFLIVGCSCLVHVVWSTCSWLYGHRCLKRVIVQCRNMWQPPACAPLAHLYMYSIGHAGGGAAVQAVTMCHTAVHCGILAV
jgi:hypothetical protein